MTSGTTANYTYDAAGSVTSDGVHTYQYDAENRIVNVDGGSTASSAYDQQNRRYKKTVGSSVTHYVWQGSQVLAEHDGSTGAVVTDYVYSGSQMIAKVATGTTQYFLGDRLSKRLALDTSGNVVGRQAHLPFGEDFAESGTQEKHHFTTYERDAESGTDYAVNRGYSSALGRFQEADPYKASGEVKIPKSWNRYSYVLNNPINFTDPSGLLLSLPPLDPGMCYDLLVDGLWFGTIGDCGGGSGFWFGGGGGGSGTEPEPVSCTIEVYDRVTEFGGGIRFPGNRHGYIVFTDEFGVRHFFEGIKDKKTKPYQLRASESSPPNLALKDHPETDRFDGGTSGPNVCGWLSKLRQDVDSVNNAHIKYNLFGPNSTSVLRYMLQSLPDLSWFHKHFMVGWGSRLPGVEP